MAPWAVDGLQYLPFESPTSASALILYVNPSTISYFTKVFTKILFLTSGFSLSIKTLYQFGLGNIPGEEYPTGREPSSFLCSKVGSIIYPAEIILHVPSVGKL